MTTQSKAPVEPDPPEGPEEVVTGLAADAATEEAPATVAYVFWNGPAHVERGLTVEDFASIGVEAEKAVWWNRDNGWRVRRDRIPMSDEQLAWFLAREPLFKLREVEED